MKIKEITDKLEQGIKEVFTSENYKEYLQAMGKFHNYSLNNCLLIAMQCPQATTVAGYNTWKKEFGRQVKKGEKAIRILAPIKHKMTREEKGEDGTEQTKEIQYITYRPVPVFDISQTEGEEMPQICKQLEGNCEELIEKVKAASPVPVRFEKIEGTANGYFHHDGYIVVDSDLSQKQTVKTLIHEITHASIHCKGGEQEKADRRTKEVQAESVADAVCDDFGVETSEYSFGYIAAWSEGKELDELRGSLEIIHRTAVEIIEKIA